MRGSPILVVGIAAVYRAGSVAARCRSWRSISCNRRGRQNPQRIAALAHTEQCQQVSLRQGDAAFGRRIARSRHVQEDGAAPSGDWRIVVTAQLDNDVVDLVIPPQPLVPRRVWQDHWSIVVHRLRVVTPAVVRANAPRRQGRRRCQRQTIGAIPDAAQRPGADRCRAVAFALIGACTAATQGTGH